MVVEFIYTSTINLRTVFLIIFILLKIIVLEKVRFIEK